MTSGIIRDQSYGIRVICGIHDSIDCLLAFVVQRAE